MEDPEEREEIHTVAGEQAIPLAHPLSETAGGRRWPAAGGPQAAGYCSLRAADEAELGRERHAREVGAQWQRLVRGTGALAATEGSLYLVNEGARSDGYTNAQIDDYQGRPRSAFLWRPPLTLTVRARFSHPGAEQDARPGTARRPQEDAAVLLGTAGFGFWNDPFMMTDRRPPALPRALWFFYASPPSDMKLDLHTPGWGWKAATIDAGSWPARLLLPLAPVAVPLMRLPALYGRLWPTAQRALNVCEAQVEVPMTGWHDYAIEWDQRWARFSVDGQTVLDCDRAPGGPLGLVIWIDNQYMVATPQGRLRHGLLDVPHRQWLEVASVAITRP